MIGRDIGIIQKHAQISRHHHETHSSPEARRRSEKKKEKKKSQQDHHITTLSALLTVPFHPSTLSNQNPLVNSRLSIIVIGCRRRRFVRGRTGRDVGLVLRLGWGGLAGQGVAGVVWCAAAGLRGSLAGGYRRRSLTGRGNLAVRVVALILLLLLLGRLSAVRVLRRRGVVGGLVGRVDGAGVGCC